MRSVRNNESRRRRLRFRDLLELGEYLAMMLCEISRHTRIADQAEAEGFEWAFGLQRSG
jgi:hypothetical protein